MSFHLFDLPGFIGVVLIIVAYLLMQLERLPSSSPRYSLLNAAGALLIIVSLTFAFNLSAFIVEAFWFLISLMGLWRSLSGGSIRHVTSSGKTIADRGHRGHPIEPVIKRADSTDQPKA